MIPRAGADIELSLLECAEGHYKQDGHAGGDFYEDLVSPRDRLSTSMADCAHCYADVDVHFVSRRDSFPSSVSHSSSIASRSAGVLSDDSASPPTSVSSLPYTMSEDAEDGKHRSLTDDSRCSRYAETFKPGGHEASGML